MTHVTGTNEDVYGLILGMSSAERQLFQKMVRGRSSQNSPLHLRLFDLIANDGIVGDLMAKPAIGITNNTQFSNLKNHLANEILDILTFHNRDQSPQMLHSFGIMQLEFLIARGNYYLARRAYKRLWAQAELRGQYSWAIQLLKYRQRLHFLDPSKKSKQESTELESITALYISYRKTDLVLEQMADRLKNLKAETPLRFLPSQRGEVLAIFEALTQIEAESRATDHLFIRFLAVISETLYMLQEFESCSQRIDKALALIRSDPALILPNSDQFLGISGTAFYNAFAESRVFAAIDLLETFDQFAQVFNDDLILNKRWSIIRFNTALKIANKTANYKEVQTLLYDRADIIQIAHEVLRPEDAISVMTSIAISLFVMDDYVAAEHLILDIKEMNRSLDREDMLYFSLVFHLLILYEQRSWYRLDSATEAAYHLLYSRKKLRPFEKELMRFLKHLPVYRGKGTTTHAIRTFVEKLESFRNDPIQRLYFLYFNYYDWLQSKLAGLSYREYKRQLLATAV